MEARNTIHGRSDLGMLSLDSSSLARQVVKGMRRSKQTINNRAIIGLDGADGDVTVGFLGKIVDVGGGIRIRRGLTKARAKLINDFVVKGTGALRFGKVNTPKASTRASRSSWVTAL